MPTHATSSTVQIEQAAPQGEAMEVEEQTAMAELDLRLDEVATEAVLLADQTAVVSLEEVVPVQEVEPRVVAEAAAPVEVQG